MTIQLSRSGREFHRWPVTGTAQPLEISVGGAAYVTLTLDSGYVADPPVAGATWWRVMLAGPDVDTADPDIGLHPLGTIVVSASTEIRGRVVSGVGGEVLEEFIEWVVLS